MPEQFVQALLCVGQENFQYSRSFIAVEVIYYFIVN